MFLKISFVAFIIILESSEIFYQKVFPKRRTTAAQKMKFSIKGAMKLYSIHYSHVVIILLCTGL